MAIVRNIMNTVVYSLPSTATIGDTIRMMAEKKIGGMPLVNENNVPIAYVSDGDILSYIIKNVEKRNSKFLNIRGWYDLDCFSQYLNYVVNDSVMSCATQRLFTVEADVRERDAAKFMGKGDKDSQTQAIYDYFKLKFGADQVNSIFGVMKNLSSVLKK